ncbi:MFS transporter [Streptosporangium sp. KLBMP 9127]|nr:MFS transporter [Streptosporangium sp. KLBMP 9127]
MTRGWAMWSLGAVVYAAAMFHRTSLAVAADLAEERFGIGPGALSLLAVYQLLAYAVLLLPAGLAADRLGPRRTLLLAIALVGGGQIAFALVTSFPLGVLARGVLGCGDALTFMGVLRLIVAWCPPKRVALLVQLVSVIGMAGSLIGTVPLSLALTGIGWTPTFLGSGAATAVLALVVYAAVPKDPAEAGQAGLTLRELRGELRTVWQVPGTRLGMWMVITSSFSFVSFSTLWGFPYLTRAQGLSTGSASSLLTLLIMANMAMGPVFGQLASRYPRLRVHLNASVIAVVAVVWTTLLAWPDRAPAALLVVLVLALGLCGPATMVGMDVARTSNPSTRVATAAATVNLGGYVAALLVILTVGVVLQSGRQWGLPTATAFTLAFAMQLALFLFGGFRIFGWARKVHAREGLPR